MRARGEHADARSLRARCRIERGQMIGMSAEGRSLIA